MVQQIPGPAAAKTDKKFEVFLARAEYFHSRAGVDAVHSVVLAHHYTDRGIGEIDVSADPSSLIDYLRTFGSWSTVASIKPIVASLYKAGFEGIAGGSANASPVDRLSALSGHYHSGQLKVAHLIVLTHFYATDSAVTAMATQMGKNEKYQSNPAWFKVVVNAGLRFGGFGLSDWLLKKTITWVETNIDGGVFDGYENKHVADTD